MTKSSNERVKRRLATFESVADEAWANVSDQIMNVLLRHLPLDVEKVVSESLNSLSIGGNGYSETFGTYIEDLDKKLTGFSMPKGSLEQ